MGKGMGMGTVTDANRELHPASPYLAEDLVRSEGVLRFELIQEENERYQSSCRTGVQGRGQRRGQLTTTGDRDSDREDEGSEEGQAKGIALA
eukprot:gene24676-10307_t